MMEVKGSRLILATIASLLVLALYLVGYFAVIERTSGSIYNHGFETRYYSSSARVGGRPAEWLWYPVVKLDCLLRPEHWKPVAMKLPNA